VDVGLDVVDDEAFVTARHEFAAFRLVGDDVGTDGVVFRVEVLCDA